MHHCIDDGIIDVFRIDPSLILGEWTEVIESLVFKIASQLHPQHHFSKFWNFYSYDTVKTPRCFHRDSLNLRIKCFVPLSSCQELSEGPYGVKLQSHNTNKFLLYTSYLVNAIFGSDLGDSPLDATLCSSNSITPIFYTIGDIVIGYQNAIHGDFPCRRKSFSRSALVLNLY